MIFTVTALPSAAETHGNHSANDTVPLVSTAPSVPIGSRLGGTVRERSQRTIWLGAPCHLPDWRPGWGVRAAMTTRRGEEPAGGCPRGGARARPPPPPRGGG